MYRMMYGFAFIRAQRGPWEEKTEMTVLRVGSNLNQFPLTWMPNDKETIFGHLTFGQKFSDQIIIDFGQFRTILDKISDTFKQVNKISDIYDLIMSRQIIHQI